MKARRTVGGALVGVGVLLVLGSGGPAAAAEAPVGLGTAAAFAVLSGSTVTNTGPSVVSGELGVSPGTAITGFPPGVVLNGSQHPADALADQAQLDVTTAYDDAAGRSTSATISSDLGGQTLLPGVYTGATLGLTGTLTLDAQGDPNAVFVFQAGSTFITATSSQVVLAPGTNPCSVYWQVGSSVTLGTDSTLVGTVLAHTAVTANTGALVTGRLLAQTAAVTLDTASVTLPTCSATPSPSPSASASTSPSASSSASPSVSASAGPSPSASASPSPTLSATPSASSSPSTVPTTTAFAPPGVGAASTSPTPFVGPVAGPTAAPPTGPVAGALPQTGTRLAAALQVGLLLVGCGLVLCLSAVRRVP